MGAQVRIGTSGWHYQHWRGKFYPSDIPPPRMFEYYQRFFDTVELNNSFYRLPYEQAFACWRDASPGQFLFTVKASRFLTHNKKLKDPDEPIQRLFSRAEVLGNKLGPVLFQLPPKWKVNLQRLEAFLQKLPLEHDYAFEFREPSWNIPEVYTTLRRHNAAYCIYELAGFHTPLLITADFAYVRLHGPGGKYQGSYTDKQLLQWADQITSWSRTLNSIYVYFDNDDSAYAAHNALALKQLLTSQLAGTLDLRSDRPDPFKGRNNSRKQVVQSHGLGGANP